MKWLVLSVLLGTVTTTSVLLLAAPAPRQVQSIPQSISPANADKLASLKTVNLDVYRLVRGRGPKQMYFVRWENPVELFDVTDFRPLRTIGGNTSIIEFSASKDDRLFAWAPNATRFSIESTAGGKPIEVETGQQQPCARISPNGKHIASGGYGRTAKLWDLAGQPLANFDGGAEGGLTPVFSPDGKLLVIGNRNDVTRLYDVESRKLLHTFKRPMTHEIAFSPDGRRLAAAYVDGGLGIWDVNAGESIALHPTANEETYSLDWNPAGTLLATSGLNGKVQLWETSNWNVVKELKSDPWMITVRFTSDGTRLLTAGGSQGPNATDRKITVWSVPEQ